ncbi:heme d1 biosynthesis radical SAM protein NirJ2 [Paenibacillus sp. CAA11]|uniref:radical SAM/SPASM domain-containing protein n=1 Tax=Paenibacillus sp. CAA11 TaxID=1532905 RepID=UPI000D363D41|nr:radical SAM protein [Paenibacillus sp. CAA11]AWB43875.1 heme d1 biosynthesis radical SAM protein NirJ2 [Paenibacillus sp. CAA11]
MLISWNITKRCNLFCDHCYRDSGPDAATHAELNTTEGKQLIRQIARANFKLLVLSGGEPMLRKDLPELIAEAHAANLRTGLGTNGTLMTRSAAQELKSAGLSGVAISLDSSSPDHHNRFRNSYGSWQRAIRGIEHALDAGLRVQVNMTMTEHNADDFEALTDKVVELGVHALHPFFLVPTGRGINIEEDALKRDQYFDVLKATLKKQPGTPIEIKPTCAPQFMPMAKELGIPMRYTRGCLAGVSYCSVLPDGEVHVCPYLPVKAGHVRETPFDEVWNNSSIFQTLRTADKYEGACGLCPDQGICGGCRARAYYYSGGNMMAEEPWCYKRTGGL